MLNFLQSSDIQNDCFVETHYGILVDLISFNFFQEAEILRKLKFLLTTMSVVHGTYLWPMFNAMCQSTSGLQLLVWTRFLLH